jgi:predicted nucleic acid-binding protein
LAIAFYFAEKKHKSQLAKQKIDLLCQHIKIAENSSKSVLDTLSNKSIHDFEDGLEYYAAKSVECKCIITEDIEDFYFSEIEILNCQEFFKRYLLN